MTSDPPNRPRPGLATAARVIGGAGLLAAGVLAAGAFTNSAPAAPQDCLPVVGCVTTVVPTVTLPGVTVTVPTLPTLPGTTTTTTPTTTTTTTTAPSTSASSTTTATTATTTTTDSGGSPGAAAFSPKANVRVRGRGARRLVEIRVNLTKAARLNALLTGKRGGRIARRLFTAGAGPHLFRLRVGRAAKPGLANLSLVYRATTGEAARTTHRLRLPR